MARPAPLESAAMRSHPWVALGARLAVALVVALAVLAPTGPADGTTGVSLHASISGRGVDQGTERHPIRLEADAATALEVKVDNEGDQPVDVRTVRLSGRVMGLTFYAYDTSVHFTVDGHHTETRRFPLDLRDLAGQAIGLVPSSVAVLDENRHEIASQSFVADVRGKLRSVYGVFGIAIAVLTALWFAGALVALARGRLSTNRWRRGLRFLTPGLGLGLTLVFTLSALRVLAPQPSRWFPTVVVAAAVLFAIGYLTPDPAAGDLGDDEDDEDDDEDGDVGEEPPAATDGPPAATGTTTAPPA